MDISKAVLLVVDMQNGFLGSKSVHIVPQVVDVVQGWMQRTERPVIFTRFVNVPGSAYERLIHWHRLQASPETDLHEDLLPFARNVVTKNFYSAFTAKLDSMLADCGADTVIICGVATDGCVLKSAVDAFERGLTPYVIKDACASHAGEEIHQMGLTLIGRYIGRDQLIQSSDLKDVLNG